jgi:hypothetical protein
MAWSTTSNGVPGVRTRGGVGNQQSQNSGSLFPVARGGPIATPPAPPVLNPNPPSLRTSIADAAVAPGPTINAVIPQMRRRSSIAWQYTWVAPHDHNFVPMQMPSFRVPIGATVRVRASNPGGANVNAIFVATDYWTILNMAFTDGPVGSGSILQSLDDVEFNVANVAEIWIKAAWKDGAIISVNRPLQQ